MVVVFLLKPNLLDRADAGTSRRRQRRRFSVASAGGHRGLGVVGVGGGHGQLVPAGFRAVPTFRRDGVGAQQQQQQQR